MRLRGKRYIHMFNTEKRLAPIISKLSPETVVGWYFPNNYDVGMSGLGYQLVWWLFEQDPRLEVKRGFLDIQESGIEASQLLGFTVSWELDFVNILKILERHHVPALVKERKNLDEHPSCLWRRAGAHSQIPNPSPISLMLFC